MMLGRSVKEECAIFELRDENKWSDEWEKKLTQFIIFKKLWKNLFVC